MKKIPLTIISLLLISGGWFLEVYYYQYRFTGDGITPIVSLIIGLSLTLLLSMLFLLPNWKSKIARVVLIVFSIFCTVSGQGVQMNEKDNINTEKTVLNSTKQSVFNEYSDNINTIKQQIEDKNNLLPKNLKERTYLNTNGVQPLLKEIEDLRTELKRYEALRDGTINSLSTSSGTTLSAYELLANDLGIHSPTPIKLLSQVLLSLFIALMAPTGIVILLTAYPHTKKEEKSRVGEVVEKKESTVVNTTPKVTKDSVLMYLERWGDSELPKVLKSRSYVCNKTGLSVSVFNKITEKARRLNLIDSNGNSTVPCVKRSEFLLMYKNNVNANDSVVMRG